MRYLKYALGTLFGLVVLAVAPDALAATISISANVQGYTWSVTGPISGSGTGNAYYSGLPDGTYTVALTAVPPADGSNPGGYYLAGFTGANPQAGGNIVWTATFLPNNNATFVSQSVGTSMTAGTQQNVSLTFTNNGGVTWSAAQNYILGSANPYNNNTWGASRVSLPYNVAPGQSVTFSFPIVAPAAAGSYNFQAQMLREGVQWFGAPSTNVVISVAAPYNNADFISQTAVPTLTTGQPYSYSVTYNNNGTTTWTPGAFVGGYRLGAINPYDNSTWGAARVELPNNVAPGQNVTITFNIMAPATPGTYNLQNRMAREGYEWFGETSTNQVVTVNAPAAPTITSFYASPATVSYNGSTTIYWAANNATTCTSPQLGSGGASGSVPVNNLTATTQYSMSCTGPGGPSGTSYTTVTVNPPPAATITSFYASPATVSYNGSTTIYWAANNASTCTSPQLGSAGASGSVPVSNLTATTQYSLTCNGPGGPSGTSYTTVTVNAPSAPTAVFEGRVDAPSGGGGWTSADSSISYGTTVEFRWGNVTNASACYVWPLQGFPQFNGMQNAEYPNDGAEYGPVNTPGTFVVELRCRNLAGVDVAVSDIQVTVGNAPEPSVDLKVFGQDGPVTANYGSTIDGSWTMANLDSCTITANSTPVATVTASGSGTYGPFTAPITFAISCTGPYGGDSDLVFVNMAGTIYINSNLPTGWNITGPQNYASGAYPSGVIPNAPFGAYTLTLPAAPPGYDVTIGPCVPPNPMNLNATPEPCD